MAHGFPDRFKLAAIDVDGTLVGSNLGVSDVNCSAVARLQAAGLEVVLASGRHFETLRPFADIVPGIRWLVAAQGGDVANLDRSVVLARVFLDDAVARRIVALAHRLGFFVALYTEEGIFVDNDATVTGFYTRLAGRAPRKTSADWVEQRLLKIVWIGEPENIAALAGRPELVSIRTEQVRTHERLFEFSPPGVSKASGLVALAKHLGVRGDQTVAFGDAENDLPMFAWSGLSVAMAHGWPAALACATVVAPPGPVETALARAVDFLFERDWPSQV